jgi:ADP-L-glycero-D-manno-heptose 6-epimerase
MFDQYAHQAGFLNRLVGLKYFNVFGPNEDHKGDMRSVVHKAFQQIQATGSVKLFKSYHPDFPDGGQQRDFLYVKDAVEMTLHLATSQAGGLYNIGSGQAHTWIELVTPIFAALNRQPRIEFIEMPETLRSKYQYFTQANIAKLRASGYAAKITPLDKAVTDYVRNYLIPGRKLGDEPAKIHPPAKLKRGVRAQSMRA